MLSGEILLRNMIFKKKKIFKAGIKDQEREKLNFHNCCTKLSTSIKNLIDTYGLTFMSIEAKKTIVIF